MIRVRTRSMTIHGWLKSTKRTGKPIKTKCFKLAFVSWDSKGFSIFIDTFTFSKGTFCSKFKKLEFVNFLKTILSETNEVEIPFIKLFIPKKNWLLLSTYIN